METQKKIRTRSDWFTVTTDTHFKQLWSYLPFSKKDILRFDAFVGTKLKKILWKKLFNKKRKLGRTTQNHKGIRCDRGKGWFNYSQTDCASEMIVL
jgi:hypothetical protein